MPPVSFSCRRACLAQAAGLKYNQCEIFLKTADEYDWFIRLDS